MYSNYNALPYEDEDPYDVDDTVSYYSDEYDEPQEFPTYVSSPIQQPVIYSNPYDTEPYSSGTDEYEEIPVPTQRTAVLIPHYFSDDEAF